MSIKNLIKDTWVLGLALIIGGVIVYKNATETPNVENKIEIPAIKEVVKEPIKEKFEAKPKIVKHVVKRSIVTEPQLNLTLPFTSEARIESPDKNRLPSYLMPTSVNFEMPESERLTQ